MVVGFRVFKFIISGEIEDDGMCLVLELLRCLGFGGVVLRCCVVVLVLD